MKSKLSTAKENVTEKEVKKKAKSKLRKKKVTELQHAEHKLSDTRFTTKQL